MLSGRDPNKTVVAEDDAGAAGQLVEVCLPPLDQAGGNLDESTLGQFPVLQRSVNKIKLFSLRWSILSILTLKILVNQNVNSVQIHENLVWSVLEPSL